MDAPLAAGVALPSVNKILAISGWLYVAAKCKGVDPCASFGSMIIPGLFNNVVKASWLPKRWNIFGNFNDFEQL